MARSGAGSRLASSCAASGLPSSAAAATCHAHLHVARINSSVLSASHLGLNICTTNLLISAHLGSLVLADNAPGEDDRGA